jgi:hypothetical protein
MAAPSTSNIPPIGERRLLDGVVLGPLPMASRMLGVGAALVAFSRLGRAMPSGARLILDWPMGNPPCSMCVTALIVFERHFGILKNALCPQINKSKYRL